MHEIPDRLQLFWLQRLRLALFGLFCPSRYIEEGIQLGPGAQQAQNEILGTHLCLKSC